MICLCAWGLITEADNKEEYQVVDLTDSLGSPTDINVSEHAVYLHLPTLVEQYTEEAQQREEREKTEALCIVASEIIKDNWETANKR